MNWKKGSILEEEIIRDDFDSTAFIDRIFTRTTGEMKEDTFDVNKLKSNFELIISNLQILRTQVNNRISLNQQKCSLAEQTYKSEIKGCIHQTEKFEDKFRALEKRVRHVSERVYVGDQLEHLTTPKNNLNEAKDVIFEFYKYISGPVSLNLTDDEEEEVLLESAERIQRLSNLCLELPDDLAFLTAKGRIKMSHEEIDNHLISRFKLEMSRNNTDSMKRIVNSLSFSKKFSSFITTFVEQCVNKITIHQDLIGHLLTTCKENNEMIEAVFPNPNVVMLQLLQSIFSQPLKKNIETRIPSPDGDLDQFLINVYAHYVKLDVVVKQLTAENWVQDGAAVNKLFKELFKPYLKDYIQYEMKWLRDRLDIHLTRFYTSLNHQKKSINEKGIVDYFHSKFTISGSSLTSEERDNLANKMLLSQEVAVNVLEDVKISLKRCKMLSSTTVLSEDIKQIMDILVEYLIVNYLNYGIYMSIQSHLHYDSKREPNLLFFQVVHEANNIFQFFDKVVSDTILPSIANPTIHSICVTKRQEILKDLEAQINQGLDKLLQNSIGYTHYILTSEQKKTDYKPESLSPSNSTSIAAERVLQFLRKLPPQIDIYLDGQNREMFCQEFGFQFHRTLMDHLYSYSYNCEGGYVAMQDVNLYDEIMRKFKCPLLNQLFNVLLTLVNVVSMKQENLNSILRNHLDNGIPKELLINFVNLRVDYKSLKNIFDNK